MKTKKGLMPIKLKVTKIKYDGKYPNLCSGQLVVCLGIEEWVFLSHCLSSGGGVSFDEGYSNEEVTSGEWSICFWPKDFPEAYKERVVEMVNNEVTHGCCGGCV